MKKAILFGGLPVIAGIALIVMWWRGNGVASRGADWLQVPATIETVRAEPQQTVVAYKYEVAGREYHNPNGRVSARGNPRFAPGAKILAYANPKAPAESLLERSPAPSSMPMIAGLVLMIIGFPVSFFFLRENARKPAVVKHTTHSGTGSGRSSISRLKAPPSIPRPAPKDDK